jgi:CheY-like chemotaxis protein
MHELKSSPSTAWIPILIVSVMDEPKMGFALGATDYLIKPIGRETLLESIRKHVPPTPAGPVLVVDDEAESLEMVSTALDAGGYSSIQAQTGQEALRVLSESPVSALILDLIMPDLNGFEVIEQIRNQPKLAHLPIIVLTAKQLTAADLDLLRGNVSSCLQKGASWKSKLLDQLRVSLNSSLPRA